jgi:hypothetical protein
MLLAILPKAVSWHHLFFFKQVDFSQNKGAKIYSKRGVFQTKYLLNL